MRWQTTAVLAVILVALGAFFYVYEVRWGPEREKTEARKGRVFTVESADVTAAEIRREKDVVRATRDGEGWRLEQPVATRGDRGAIEEMLTSVTTAKMDREIASAPASLADFGLDRPAAAVTLTLKDGKRLGLLIGAKNPTGVWVYAKEPDKAAVFVLPESVLRDTTKPVADYRDKSILTFDRNAVSGTQIVTREETLELALTDGKWRLVRPVGLPADGEAVGDFLDKLQAARVKEFVAEAPPSLTPYGLDRPVRVEIAVGRDKDRATKALLLGRSDDARKGIFAMRPGEPSVLLLPEEVWTALPKNVAVLRSKTFVEFDRDKVARVEVQGPRGTLTLAREGTAWRITAPEALAADAVEVGVLLRKARELRAQAFLTEDASGIARYLRRPEVKVTVTEEGGASRSILLAPSPDRRGGAATAYAAVEGQGPVVLVEAAALGDLGRSVTDLRDRRLLGEVEPKEVKRLTVRRAGATAVLEREGETGWRMVEPAKGAARAGRADDLLYAVRALKWKDVIAPGGEEPSRFGLDQPELEITLARADGSEIGTLVVGKKEGERLFVRTKASPAVYAVDARALGDLPKVPDDFKG